MVGTIPEVTIPDVPLGPEIGCPVMVFKMAVSSFKVNFVPWQRPSMLLATHLYPESGAWKSPVSVLTVEFWSWIKDDIANDVWRSNGSILTTDGKNSVLTTWSEKSSFILIRKFGNMSVLTVGKIEDVVSLNVLTIVSFKMSSIVLGFRFKVSLRFLSVSIKHFDVCVVRLLSSLMFTCWEGAINYV